jgi:hypothetical protein
MIDIDLPSKAIDIVHVETEFDLADGAFQYAPAGAILSRDSIQQLLKPFEDSAASCYAVLDRDPECSIRAWLRRSDFWVACPGKAHAVQDLGWGVKSLMQGPNLFIDRVDVFYKGIGGYR